MMASNMINSQAKDSLISTNINAIGPMRLPGTTINKHESSKTPVSSPLLSESRPSLENTASSLEDAVRLIDEQFGEYRSYRLELEAEIHGQHPQASYQMIFSEGMLCKNNIRHASYPDESDDSSTESVDSIFVHKRRHRRATRRSKEQRQLSPRLE